MIIADTGFWLALANQDDQHHFQARQAMQMVLERKERLVTTCAVMAETSHLLLRDLGTQAQQEFIESYRAKGFDVFELQPVHAAKKVFEPVLAGMIAAFCLHWKNPQSRMKRSLCY